MALPALLLPLLKGAGVRAVGGLFTRAAVRGGAGSAIRVGAGGATRGVIGRGLVKRGVGSGILRSAALSRVSGVGGAGLIGGAARGAAKNFITGKKRDKKPRE